MIKKCENVVLACLVHSLAQWFSTHEWRIWRNRVRMPQNCILTFSFLLFPLIPNDGLRISRNVESNIVFDYCGCFVCNNSSSLIRNNFTQCKLESLQRVGSPGWWFPQTAGCKARTCFVDSDKWRKIPSIGVFHQCWHQLKNFEKQRKGLRTVALNFCLVKAEHCYFRLFVPWRQCKLFTSN